MDSRVSAQRCGVIPPLGVQDPAVVSELDHVEVVFSVHRRQDLERHPLVLGGLLEPAHSHVGHGQVVLALGHQRVQPAEQGL